MKLRKRRRASLTPIPFVISFHLTFLNEGLSEQEYEREVRRIVREKLPETDFTQDGLWEEYDEFVGRIIKEELVRN